MKFCVCLFFVLICGFHINAHARIDMGQALPTDPEIDKEFLLLTSGFDLKNIIVRGTPLYLAAGMNQAWGPIQKQKYSELINAHQNSLKSNLQWVLMNLETGEIESQSCHPQLKFYGASVSKMFVAATLLNLQNGKISRGQKQRMADMLVVSSNKAWIDMQRFDIGEGSTALGQERIHQFTQQMGYERTRGFRGWWNDLHGNELTAFETAKFIYDTYQDNYPGAEMMWKILFTARTGTKRGRKYLPADEFVGGKTGYYSGKTVDPESGSSTFPDGRPYEVHVRHHAMIYKQGGSNKALVILNNTGQSENAALIAGGLYYEALPAMSCNRVI